MSTNNAGGTLCFFKPSKNKPPVLTGSCSYLSETDFLNFINTDLTTLEGSIPLNQGFFLKAATLIDVSATTSDDVINLGESIVNNIKGITFKTFTFNDKSPIPEYTFTATEENLTSIKSSLQFTSYGAFTLMTSGLFSVNGHDYTLNAQLVNMNNQTFVGVYLFHSTFPTEKSVNIIEICMDLGTFTPYVTDTLSGQPVPLDVATQGSIPVCEKIGNYATLRKLSTLG